MKEAFTLQPLTITIQILRYEKFYAIYLKSNKHNFLILPYFACHTPQFKMLMPFFERRLNRAKLTFLKIQDLLFTVVMVISIFVFQISNND